MKYEEIKKIICDFEISDLTELEINFNDISIKMKKDVNKEIENKKLKVENGKNEEWIRSKVVGIFKLNHINPINIKLGTHVKLGDTLCYIDTMKLTTEIKSPVDGIIREIIFKDGDVVGFEDILLKIEIAKVSR